MLLLVVQVNNISVFDYLICTSWHLIIDIGEEKSRYPQDFTHIVMENVNFIFYKII
jgi:hypothetical protein